MPEVQSQTQGIYTTSFFGNSVVAAFSGRNYPQTRRTEFLSALKLSAQNLFLMKQVHGNRVWDVDKMGGAPESVEGDGAVTSRTDVALGILTADCVPVFLAGAANQAAALAHAGWKGLRAGILEGTLEQLKQKSRSPAGSFRSFLGPGIRKCCYEVGPEFKNYFPAAFHERNNGCYVDLFEEAKRRLQTAGLSAAQIEDSGICTACQNDRFYSARREGTAERILSVIAIRP